jgi:homoprotocatechuate degradation regulator HpaR
MDFRMQSSKGPEQDNTPRPKAKGVVNALPLSLVRARESVMGHFRNLLRRYDLTEPQWRVLRTVDQLNEIEMTELSRVTALLMPSLSRITRELELRGYLCKEADPADLRRMLVRLSDKGRLLVEMASPECEAVYRAIRHAMGNEKLRELNALLGELEMKLADLNIEFEGGDTIPSNVMPVVPAKQRGRPAKKIA